MPRGLSSLISPLAMPPKGKRAPRSSSSSSKKAKRASDWRSPLFYWRGTVAGGVWEGTWVASTDGLPSDADFAASANSFKLTSSTAHLGTLHAVDGGASLTGMYKLDNGEGLADVSDIEHRVCARRLVVEQPLSPTEEEEQPSNASWAVVGACGDTEFGPFVSLGRLDTVTPTTVTASEAAAAEPVSYTRLTLARRYLSDKDKRVGMSAMEVVDRVYGVDAWAIQLPWLALPHKPHPNWPASILPAGSEHEVVPVLEAKREEVGTEWGVGLAPVEH